MPALRDADLYRRGTETLIATWDAYARAATGAAVRRFAGATAAVFPIEPEHSVYNNAVLQRDLTAAERVTALSTGGHALAVVASPPPPSATTGRNATSAHSSAAVISTPPRVRLVARINASGPSAARTDAIAPAMSGARNSFNRIGAAYRPSLATA